MAVHARFESWYISLPFCAKQQREMKFGERAQQWLSFRIFFWN